VVPQKGTLSDNTTTLLLCNCKVTTIYHTFWTMNLFLFLICNAQTGIPVLALVINSVATRTSFWKSPVATIASKHPFRIRRKKPSTLPINFSAEEQLYNNKALPPGLYLCASNKEEQDPTSSTVELQHHDHPPHPIIVTKKSRICQIRCQNLAGITTMRTRETSEEDVNVVLQLDRNITNEKDSDLIAITGETGSGKSLLIGRVADLVTGGKALVSMIDSTNHRPTTAMAEMTFSLHPSHMTMVTETLQQCNIDPTVILGSGSELTLKRILRRCDGPQRLQSLCFLNDHDIPLPVLRAVGRPMLAIVNAPAAAAALNEAKSRLSMLDTGVSSILLRQVQQCQALYRRCQQYRQLLEQELSRQNLPTTMRGMEQGDDKDFDLLRHWIQELDGYEGRIGNMRDTIVLSTSSVLDGDDGDDGDDENASTSNILTIIEALEATQWMDSDGSDSSFSSTMYRLMLELLEEIKSLDGKIISATKARDALLSLSAPDSAYTAIERSRKLLLGATRGMRKESNNKSKVSGAAEKSHELLNQVEEALLECGDFLDHEHHSLLAALQETRKKCPLSYEKLLEYVMEWNTLARKHGISPYQLPSCHASLRNELTGGIEARKMLPLAMEAEKNARHALVKGCRLLTESRSTLCVQLSKSITERLPLLGMENARFEARLKKMDNPTFGLSHVGVDEVDFYLFHGTRNGQIDPSIGRLVASERNGGGKLENVGSSGEKARILLAIECVFPGAVRALCGSSPVITNRSSDTVVSTQVPPVAVIYDEIDAHVGGRASTSVAQMLVDQSRSCQVLSITHSPSLAALADTHICVAKMAATTNGENNSLISVKLVEGTARQKELARMASGDIASEEAEIFAMALLRDARGKAQQ
jgi:DNA repair ATPase RecN